MSTIRCLAWMVVSSPCLEFFILSPLVGTTNPLGTCMVRFHLSGGAPPVAKIPSAGKSSGAHPCAGRKKASEAKPRKDDSPGPGVSKFKAICKLCRPDTVHGCGNLTNVL